MLSDDSREGLSPIRDLVNPKGPMAQKVNKSGNADLSMTAVESAPANVFERYMTEDIDLHNEMFNEKAENIKMARQKMISRIIIEKSPDDKSNMSKSRRGKLGRQKSTAAPSMFGGTSDGRGSINDSMQD